MCLRQILVSVKCWRILIVDAPVVTVKKKKEEDNLKFNMLLIQTVYMILRRWSVCHRAVGLSERFHVGLKVEIWNFFLDFAKCSLTTSSHLEY